MNDAVLCYDVDVSRPLRCAMVGIREPKEPFPQPRRVREDFVAFLVVRGEIFLTDYLPDADPVIVRPGDIHVIAPGLPQASTVPFAPGIKFLWFHFEFARERKLCNREQALSILRDLYKPGHAVVPQPRWLIPRHLSLGGEVDSFCRMHAELLDNTRLWGLDDAGTQAICAHMVYLLHRLFAAEMLRGASIGSEFGARVSPESAHASRARQFIRLNYERSISLSDVADAVELNPSYLSRCFKRVTGLTVVDFILKTRIEAAKSHLQEGSGSIKEIAFMSGFASSAYFCRIFKRFERQTPLEYAQKNHLR
ncbi:MAG TPA: AraC family transcriptional regulator [Planctomycetota bacterium]|nr:AraC family transcriptional regulator [Planctomycetota bacterium]